MVDARDLKSLGHEAVRVRVPFLAQIGRVHLSVGYKIFILGRGVRFSYALQRIVLWCNGSTTGFGSVCPSSNLGRIAIF